MARPGPGRRRRASATLEQIRPELEVEAERRLGRPEAASFLARVDTHFLDIYEPVDALYVANHDVDELVQRLVLLALWSAADRSADLRELDRRREVDPQWYQRERLIGYVCYVDRFCDTLAELPTRLDYLAELGVTYLHLMPVLRPREGENDGGYAVLDYRAIDPRLGTMDDLEEVARILRGRGISLCVDVVLNHTAKEHEWARRWIASDPAYADFYTAFPDRTMPDAYERTIAEVFPDRSPGSFSWFDEANGGAGGWVWTTFWSFQWDLNYANPNVFAAMLETILWLANRGIDVFRLDAIPFAWKRLGSSCVNEPEVHSLIQALHALVRLAAPAAIFKAEAIVAPEYLVPYLGAHDRYRPECELAYHNQLMVMLWSSLATKDARLAAQSLRRMSAIPAQTSWVTYARCHDDIGWAVSDFDADAVGLNGFEHRRFLNAFYSGRFPFSFARGALFQENPATGDARISGSAASLCGIGEALERGDTHALELGIRRLLLLYAVVFAYGGIPLVYMGDELALRNDTSYLDDPALTADNRWMHRPWMDWTAAANRGDPATLEGRVFGWIQRLGTARTDLLALRAGGEFGVVGVDNPHVLAWRRRHPRSGDFVGLANFAETEQSVDVGPLQSLGRLETVLSSDGALDVRDGRAHLASLGFAWLVEH